MGSRGLLDRAGRTDPTGLLLAATVALVCVGVPGSARPEYDARRGVPARLCWRPRPGWWRRRSATRCTAYPHPAWRLSPPRLEPGLGALGSLAGLGGIWNVEAVPHSRTTLFALLATTILLAVVACGAPAALRSRQAEPLLILAVVAVLVPAALATAPDGHCCGCSWTPAPGWACCAMDRKWVACDARLRPGRSRRSRDTAPLGAPAVAALLCATALIAALPDLAWGVWGALRLAHYRPGGLPLRHR